MTAYTHTLTVAVREDSLEIGNQLAVQFGENPEADVNTFTNLTHKDANGVQYAVAHTVVKEVVYEAAGTIELPEGIRIGFDADFEKQLEDWGLGLIGDSSAAIEELGLEMIVESSEGNGDTTFPAPF